MQPDVARAAGTYKYRAMGAAVISRTDLFRRADFRADRRPPPVSSPYFVGHFASIRQVNGFLLASPAPPPRRSISPTSPPHPAIQPIRSRVPTILNPARL